MKNFARKFFLAMLAVLVIGGVYATGASAPSASSGSGSTIRNLVYPIIQTRELETFNILFTQRAEDFENLANLVDGFLESDPWGTLIPALAESWGSTDGGLTWTFRLKRGLQWVDMNGRAKGPNNANDWGTGLEWILNFHKNDSLNTSMPIEMIAGAEDYYEYTKSLPAAQALALKADRGSRFFQMVGIQIPDDYTVIYRCPVAIPYFDTLALYNVLYPMAQGMIDELGGPTAVRAMNNRNMWYNGAYTMTTFVPRNEKVFTKNPLYWDTRSDRFDTVTFKMVDSSDISYQLYQSGEVDYVPLTQSNLSTIYNNPNHPYHNYLIPDPMLKYSYQFHFNYDKRNRDGTPDTNWNTAAANTAFRRAWYYGLNLVDYWRRTNDISPMILENNFFTMRGLVNTSDGTDYTELVRRELGLAPLNGVTPVRPDRAKFQQYKEQAMRELRALGVTFPVRIDHWISSTSATAMDSALVLQRVFRDSLGDDFVRLEINTYVSSLTTEVVRPRLHSIAMNGWGADYGDPQNYLSQYTYLDDNAYYSANYTNINSLTQATPQNRDLIAIYQEYTRLVRVADAISGDRDARYRAFARAEAYMLDNAIVVPYGYSQGMALGKIDNTSKIQTMYGIQDYKIKNWRTNSNGYTTAEAEALAARHAQGR